MATLATALAAAHLNIQQVNAIGIENEVQFGIQISPEVFALKDGLELFQHAQGGINVANVLKAAVDEVLQGGLQVADSHIELHKIPIKASISVVQ